MVLHDCRGYFIEVLYDRCQRDTCPSGSPILSSEDAKLQRI